MSAETFLLLEKALTKGLFN